MSPELLANMPGIPFDFTRPYPAMLVAALALPKGDIYHATGPVTGYGWEVPADFAGNPILTVNAIASARRVPLHSAQPYGEPSDALVAEAVSYLAVARNLPYPHLNVTTQATLLSFAQQLTPFAQGGPVYLPDEEMAAFLNTFA